MAFANCSLSFTIKGKHRLLTKGGGNPLKVSINLAIFNQYSFHFLTKPSTIKVSWLATIGLSPPWQKIAKFLYHFIPASPYICSPTHIRVVPSFTIHSSTYSIMGIRTSVKYLLHYNGGLSLPSFHPIFSSFTCNYKVFNPFLLSWILWKFFLLLT